MRYLPTYLILIVKMTYLSIPQELRLDVSLIEANQKHLQTIKTIRKMTYITHVARKTSKFVIHLDEALEILEKMLYYPFCKWPLFITAIALHIQISTGCVHKP